ncbi:MAG: hypothetical protein JO264_11900 [Acidisphaera sp.]|nr:hypothetical protein [Acidisphaera sp.]
MAELERLPPAQHETRDVTWRFFVIGTVGMLVTLALLAGLSALLYPASLTDRTLLGRLPPSPSPALQSSPRADMDRFRREEMQRLDSAGWVDRAHGLVHIPIAEAMRKVAQEGIADWPGPAAPSPVDPSQAGQIQEGAPRTAPSPQ